MRLTPAEEQVMMVLWKLENAFVNELIDEMPEPKPAYNTVSTIVRILEQKGCVAHESLGRSHRYFPTISKESYRKGLFSKLLDNYFGASFESMVSFFMKEQDLSLEEMEAILKRIEEKKKEDPS